MRRVLLIRAMFLGAILILGVPVFLLSTGVLRVFSMGTPLVMEPTVAPGDWVVVETWRIRSAIPNRGALIVFSAQGIPELSERSAESLFLQRLVGRPGDQLELKEGTLEVNGVRFQPAHWMGQIKPGAFLRVGEVRTVPVDAVFVLADNYPMARDSRHWGFVPTQNLVGQVLASGSW